MNSLEFTFNRFFIKLFDTSNIDNIKDCQSLFCCAELLKHSHFDGYLFKNAIILTGFDNSPSVIKILWERLDKKCKNQSFVLLLFIQPPL